MTAEDEKDDVTAADAPEAKKPAAKKAATKPAKADERKAVESDKPTAKKAAKKPARKKEPVAGEAKKAGAKAAAAKPRRRIVRAHARYVRTSARKARMVCGHLRGKSVQEARAILAFTPREVARDWSKLLESAVANAESNHELLEEDLVVREAYADEGPTIKRFRPRAMGRATPIRKRTSHLTIALTTDAAQRTTKRNG
jgi:ribosomal protein L22